MAQRVSKIKASKVVLDYDFYPRQEVSSFNVQSLVEALKAGTVLPPIIVDKASKRVIDGFHRVKAYQKAYGADSMVPCVYKEYPDDAAMFLESMEANSKHGRNLTPFDRARCLGRAEELRLDISVVAKSLNMTVESLGTMKAERLGSFLSDPVVLKRTTAHLAGTDLTAAQVEYNRHAGGMPATFFISQLIQMIESDSVDWSNEKVVDGFRRLYSLLGKADALQTVEV